jgi:hypothetical protein
MRFLRSFFGFVDTPHVSANPKHRHLHDYLEAATFDDKLTAAEQYLGIWSPEREDIRRSRTPKKATALSD